MLIPIKIHCLSNEAYGSIQFKVDDTFILKTREIKLIYGGDLDTN